MIRCECTTVRRTTSNLNDEWWSDDQHKVAEIAYLERHDRIATWNDNNNIVVVVVVKISFANHIFSCIPTALFRSSAVMSFVSPLRRRHAIIKNTKLQPQHNNKKIETNV